MSARPVRLLLGLLLVLAVALASSTASARPEAPAQRAAKVEVRPVPPAFDVAVLKYVNAERSKRGLVKLVASRCEDTSSEGWSRYLATWDAFRHQSLGPMMRRCKLSQAGENIAYGTRLTARQVVTLWMRSSGHRANILRPAYRRMGLGAWRSADTGRTYVVQNFGRR